MLSLRFALETNQRRVENGFAIYPNAKLFEAGTHKDRYGRDFSMTTDEMAQVITNFKPCGGNIEHTSFLSGKACEVRSIFADTDSPTTLRGEVAVPLWLDENLAVHEKKLSAEFDIGTKAMSGLALCVNPIVSDASLFALAEKAGVADKAQFAEHQTRSGMRVHQDVHDTVARGGAICKPASMSQAEYDIKVIEFASKSEAKGLQKIHDMTVTCGAKCEDIANNSQMYNYYSEEKVNAMNAIQLASAKFALSNDAKDKEALLALLSNAPAESKQGAKKMPEKKESLWNRLVAFGKHKGVEVDKEGTLKLSDDLVLTEKEVTELEKVEAKPADDTAKVIADPKVAELEARVAKAEAQNAVTMSRAIEAEALAFANGMIAAKKILPFEKEATIAMFKSASEDDNAHPRKVMFAAADGKQVEGNRVDALKASFAARPEHKLFSEESMSEAFVLASDKKPDDEKTEAEKKKRKEELMSKSSVGAAILAERKAKAKA